jgi:RNA polymerase sigma factor (sigma-70 family)
LSGGPTIDVLLRDLAPQALAIVARRGSFADAEDAVQEALIKAAVAWPANGQPDQPLGWLVRAASRQLIGRQRSDGARERREQLARSWQAPPTEVVPGRDDSLTLLFLCCPDELTPAAAVPLTLRAVGGLTTGEIADAFLVKEATMAQRISRAKATIRASAEPFRLPAGASFDRRLRSVLHVLYLMFNEGHTAARGSELVRPDLAAEAIRLTRMLHAARPDHPEIGGLLALLLLTEARRPARTGPRGEIVPLDEQDRALWDRALVREGLQLATTALRQHRAGPYQLQAAIAAVHDQATSHADTDWSQVLALYDALERIAPSPIVTMNRAVAVAMLHGPEAGLAILDTVAGAVGEHHRFHAVRAHLLAVAGRSGEALAEYDLALLWVTNVRERDHLQLRRAELRAAVRQPDQASASP